MNRIVRIQLLAISFALAASCGGGGEEKVRETRKPPSPETAGAIHPAFDLTEKGFETLVRGSSAPESAKNAILSAPREFLDLLLTAFDEDAEYLILVDKDRALPQAYEPKDLLDLKSLGVDVGRRNLSLREKAARALAAMAAEAKKDGVLLTASSAYRSFSYQKNVYERNVRQMGKDAADRESAMPGHSQHQLGTAVDFGSIDDSFAATPASKWLRLRAAEYGFSLSFPEGQEKVTGFRHESWHYRYIGRAAAGLERRFFGGIQQHLLAFLAENGEAFMKAKRNGNR